MIGTFFVVLFMFAVSAIVGWVGGYGIGCCLNFEQNDCFILATMVGIGCAIYANHVLGDRLKGTKFDD